MASFQSNEGKKKEHSLPVVSSPSLTGLYFSDELRNLPDDLSPPLLSFTEVVTLSSKEGSLHFGSLERILFALEEAVEGGLRVRGARRVSNCGVKVSFPENII